MSYALKKITAVLVVPAIEPSLELWENRLGFTRTAEVPHENALGFVILARDGIEVMLQSEASVRADLGSAASDKIAGVSTALFIEVSDLGAIEKTLGDYPVALPRRTTFYGMHEVGVRDPAGHFVVFAQPTGE